uniref:HMA domain-containing protein n=1 Tax=Strombidinopsis acuminata TaxID=141414 RepID=A0A7S3SJ85_9SPIT|mmetsp:Transcript_2191/g.6901  ORF Transcript_2191/g.6901 Transcript_2191/m.6901 type:complete len:109 (+) Transcript_2191:37-363(+)
MESERAHIVLRVLHLTQEDRQTLPRALMNLEGVCNVTVDVVSGVVRVDGAATDVELMRALRALGKEAVVVTHTRGPYGASPRAHSSSSAGLRAQLFLKLLRKNMNCCS